MCIKSVMPSNHLIPCRPLLLLPSIFPSIGIFPMSQFFASGGQSIGASALASVLPVTDFQSSELISFKTDWFDLLAVQGTLSLLQHHGSKASILQSFVWGCIYFETVLTPWVLFLSFIMQAQTAANLVLVIPHNCGQTLLRAPPHEPTSHEVSPLVGGKDTSSQLCQPADCFLTSLWAAGALLDFRNPPHWRHEHVGVQISVGSLL